MAAKELKGWAGQDGEIGVFLRTKMEERLSAYRASAGDVEEHANQEQEAAYGGYATRQVVELIQNAADQQTPETGGRIELRLTERYLYCADDGEPFTTGGVEALLAASRSPKRGNEQIGQFGLGFKSVLRVTSRPEVISRTGSFRFDKTWAAERIRSVVGDVEHTPILRIAQPFDPLDEAERDEILQALMKWGMNIVRLPLEPEGNDWLREQLGDFRPEFLLFADRVNQLNLIDDIKSVQRRIRRSDDDGVTTLRVNRKRSQWKVFKRIHQPSGDALAARRPSDPEGAVPLTWAVPLDQRDVRREFWAFFPTQDTSLLDGILNAPWQTTEDRLNLLDGSVYNHDLVKATANLAADSLPEFSTVKQPARHLDLLPRRADPEDGKLANQLQKHLYEILKDREIMPDQNGQLHNISKLGVAPAVLASGQQVVTAVLDLWAQYQHRPIGWLHHEALTEDRLEIVVRIATASTFRDYSFLTQSINTWLHSLLRAGIRAGDQIGASAVAVQIVAILVNAKIIQSASETGPIIATKAGYLAIVDNARVFFDSNDAFARDVTIVHPMLEEDPLAYQALQSLGIQRPSPEAAFGNVTRGVLGKSTQKNFSRLWQLSRGISKELSYSTIQQYPSWAQNLYVKTVAAEPKNWMPFDSVFIPGPIVPADGSRDALYAIDLKYHEEDLPVLRELGAVDKPRDNYGYGDSEDSWPSVLKEYREQCADDFRRNSRLLSTPQLSRLWFADMRTSGPLEAFGHLSEEGKIELTSALLDLESTFSSWTMSHLTNSDYGIRSYPSVATHLLRRYGRVRTPVGVARLSDGLREDMWDEDDEDDQVARSVRQFLLLHRKAHLIRRAFPELPDPPEGEPEPVGEDEPVAVLDEWPNIVELDAIDEWIEIVRCDGFVAIDGIEVQRNCLMQGSKIFLLRTLSEEDQIRCLLRELDIEFEDEDIKTVLEGRVNDAVEKARARIRDCDSDATRLLEAVGEDNLISLLPLSLIEILKREPKPFRGERIAETAIATFHTGALQRYKAFLKHLRPPSQWAGGAKAVGFVTDLGFDLEWAGQPKPKRPPWEDVRGPYRLPKLHDYQKRAVANIHEMLRSPQVGGENRGLLSLPTGAGKTRVAVEAIIDGIRAKEVKGTVLWIADRDELCEQAVDSWRYVWGAVRQPLGEIRMDADDLRISRLWAGQEPPIEVDSTHVVVASRQTLAARGVRSEDENSPLNDVGLVVIDEAHGGIAPAYTDILRELGLTFRRRDDEICLLGLTATPYRGIDVVDTARLVARFGDNRLDKGVFASDDAHDVIRELQNMAVLAEADHREIIGMDTTLNESELRQIREQRRPWLPESVERRIGENRKRTLEIMKAYKRYVRDENPDWPTLIFATSVSHAQTVAALLQLDGIEARAVSGETETAARRSAVEQFRSGELKVLVNYGVFREGFDAPKTRAIIVARPVYSPNLYFQMIGRGLRGVLNGGSERCLVLDVKDNVLNYDRQLAFTKLDWLWAS